MNDKKLPFDEWRAQADRARLPPGPNEFTVCEYGALLSMFF